MWFCLDNQHRFRQVIFRKKFDSGPSRIRTLSEKTSAMGAHRLLWIFNELEDLAFSRLGNSKPGVNTSSSSDQRRTD